MKQQRQWTVVSEPLTQEQRDYLVDRALPHLAVIFGRMLREAADGRSADGNDAGGRGPDGDGRVAA